jgi:hypothetical protein
MYVAGDGSVIDGGTRNARGAWGLRTQTTRRLGRLQVHWKYITSTRCECHALIAGLAASGDRRTQICDNQAAIKVLQTAREIATGRRPSHIKFRNRHRIEIRSTIALMREGGSFTATWVRSHQEGVICNDRVLVEQRAALARVDPDASEGHEAVLPGSYSDILKWDMIQLIDNSTCQLWAAFKCS